MAFSRAVYLIPQVYGIDLEEGENFCLIRDGMDWLLRGAGPFFDALILSEL